MTDSRRVNLRFCGFGGQGLILAATVLGTAAVRAGLLAVQTQSFGSEARGGECQAELSVSAGPILALSPDEVDVLVTLSQAALGRYLPGLRKDGVLFLDPQFVQRPKRENINILEVPVTRIATEELGLGLVANMVLLGCLRQVTDLVPEESLLLAIRETVPAKYCEVNVEAAERGKRLALEIQAARGAEEAGPQENLRGGARGRDEKERRR